jgi:hypothetical protein
MRESKVVLFLLLCIPLQRVSADCIEPNVSLDTLSPGVVQVTVCPAVNPPACYADTATGRMLMEALIDDFNENVHVVIAHIESTYVVDPMSPDWGTESVLVVIDTVLKGNPVGASCWFARRLWEDSGTFGILKRRKFVGFFNEIAPNNILGLGEPSPCYYEWGGGWGYFIENGIIVNTGPDALLGVSVALQSWLDAVSRVYTITTFAICNDSIPSGCYRIIEGVRNTLTDSVRVVMAVFDTCGNKLTVDDPIVKNQVPVRGYFLADSFFITEANAQGSHAKSGSRDPTRSCQSPDYGELTVSSASKGMTPLFSVGKAGRVRLYDTRGRLMKKLPLMPGRNGLSYEKCSPSR